MTNTNRPIRRALVSVFHKEGIEVLAEAFVKAGTEVVSTGSTAKKLAELGVKVTEVSDVTGFPECLDGRVKTLHPYIHAGILADMTNPEHAKQLEEFGIKPFDLVVVNLYPFADTVRSGANEADTIEKIDIGGPSMVRGAAKNHATVAIVTDPADYALVASRVADGTGFSLDERKWLAAKAFAHTAAYDATINEWTAKHWPKPASLDAVEVDKDDQGTEVDPAKFPAQFTRTWDRAHTLRYGENSHQQAALYIDPLNQTGFAHAEQLGGKGNVLMMHGHPGQTAEVKRTEGAMDILAQNPDMTLLDEQTADWDRAEAMTLMENWIQAYGDQINAVFCQNDEMALGALNALVQAGKKDNVLVVGVDAIDDALQSVKDGKMDATVYQDCKGQAEGAIEAAYKLAKGESVEKEILIPFILVTTENVDEYLK